MLHLETVKLRRASFPCNHAYLIVSASGLSGRRYIKIRGYFTRPQRCAMSAIMRTLAFLLILPSVCFATLHETVESIPASTFDFVIIGGAKLSALPETKTEI